MKELFNYYIKMSSIQRPIWKNHSIHNSLESGLVADAVVVDWNLRKVIEKGSRHLWPWFLQSNHVDSNGMYQMLGLYSSKVLTLRYEVTKEL